MAAVLTRAQATPMLLAIGFDNAKRDFVTAVRGFQTGWNLGNALKVDGVVGPNTSAAAPFARDQSESPMSSTVAARFAGST